MMAQRHDQRIDDTEPDTTSAQGEGPCLLGGPAAAAVTVAPVVDPAQL
jgi:hypothetical protein